MIVLDPVPDNKIFWVLLPLEVISAEGAQYKLFIDGVETQYDLTKFPGNYGLGMVLPPGAEYVEIIGTKVIPEFGAYAVLILGVSIFGLVFYMRKSSFGNFWTMNN